MAHIRLQNLSKIYPASVTSGQVAAVRNLTLEIRDREFMVFIGPSGCGKSTTLRMIAGLESISEGEVFIGDQCVNETDPAQRNISMVFQNFSLYPHKTVFENIAFGLKVRKRPYEVIYQRVTEAAAILGIEDLLQRMPAELSGGQTQRVAVGRAIVRKPQVFLFDEPLSNLDSKLRATMRAEISKLHARLGATMLYVTHDQVEAMTMGDRICVLNEGEMMQVGTPMQLYNAPANRFVAGFIGNPPMNFFDGHVVDQAGSSYFVEANPGRQPIRLQLPPHLATAVNSARLDGGKVILGVRPESITNALNVASNQAAYQAEATIEVSEPTGPRTHLYLDSGAHSFIAEVSSDDQYEVFQKIRLYFDMDKAHLFDPATGGSLRS
jgi:multiple sugar transport system ATP-binding protein